MTPETAWKATLGELELKMEKATFNTWLKGARLMVAENGEYVIGVQNDYAKDWLQNRLKETISRTLSAITGENITLRFVVSGDVISPEEPQEETASAQYVPATAPPQTQTIPEGSIRFNPRYTFSKFVVGANNRLAHAAAKSVVDHPGKTYNPLFIYGGVGLGKTHLLQAIGNECLAQGMSVLYVSSETFTNDLIQSIRSQKTAEFRERYRTPDLLLIDDIQFIAGKESTQEELFHTFNDLHSRGKQVVLSSDRPPKAMVTLEERLQSRFEWGLMADIGAPDLETRVAILRQKGEELNVDVPTDVLDLIAHRVRSSIRELEGALNKVVAYARLQNVDVSVDLADQALADLVSKPEKVTVEQVIETVATYFRVSLDDLQSSTRSRSIAFPRQVAMYLARTETDASYPQIGKSLGNRDHTTILYGYEKIVEKIESDRVLREDVGAIKQALYDNKPY